MAAALESGAADLAIGHYPELKASLFQQHLFTRSYSAIVRTGHPTIKAAMTDGQFQQTPIVRCTSTVAINQWLDAHFAKARQPQPVALETPYVMALAGIVGATDWVAYVPDELLEATRRLGGVRAVRVPVPVPRLAIKQHWHRRFKDDAASRFLRALVHEALHE
jgi:DNA-binding transcriptional LysR family regulator